MSSQRDFSITQREAISILLGHVQVLFPQHHWPQVWLVGGAVRDALCGRIARDLDLVAALPARDLEILGFHQVIAKSTLPIFFRSLPDGGQVEIIRVDDLSALLQDLRRRDFSINAMALSMSGELLDPCLGQNDLYLRRLQACSSDVFHDDPLRLVRALRFAADGWQISTETADLLVNTAARSALGVVPVERFSREMIKALATPDPPQFFSRMLTTSVGECFLPELFRMPQIPAGPREKHPEDDLLTHSLQVLQRVTLLSADPLVRFCALFHDLGKLATAPAAYPHHTGHQEAGALLAQDFCTRLRLPTAYRIALAGVCRLHGMVHHWVELRTATKLKLAEQALRAGIVTTLPLIAAADKGLSVVLTGWEDAIATAGKSAMALGISADQLTQLAGPERSALLVQRRVAALRGLLRRTMADNSAQKCE